MIVDRQWRHIPQVYCPIVLRRVQYRETSLLRDGEKRCPFCMPVLPFLSYGHTIAKNRNVLDIQIAA